jgi:hypothetical protein
VTPSAIPHAQCVPAGDPTSRASMRRSLLLAAIALGALAGCQTLTAPQTEATYPAIGRRLQATFPSFSAELNIHSTSSLTFVLQSAGAGNGRSETVKLRIQPVTGQVFLVTWQEASKTTVVQVHDFARNIILTNVTRPDGTFFQSTGSFVVAD